MTSIAPMNTENCTPTFNLKNYSSSDIFAPQRDVDLKLTWRKKKKKKKKRLPPLQGLAVAGFFMSYLLPNTHQMLARCERSGEMTTQLTVAENQLLTICFLGPEPLKEHLVKEKTSHCQLLHFLLPSMHSAVCSSVFI